MRIVTLTEDSKKELQEILQKRSTNSFPKQEEAVAEIIKNVRERGDEAVFSYT